MSSKFVGGAARRLHDHVELVPGEVLLVVRVPVLAGARLLTPGVKKCVVGLCCCEVDCVGSVEDRGSWTCPRHVSFPGYDGLFSDVKVNTAVCVIVTHDVFFLVLTHDQIWSFSKLLCGGDVTFPSSLLTVLFLVI